MSRREKIEALVLAAVLAGSIGAGLALSRGGHHGRPVADVDKKSDCWARADRFGHRHCDTRGRA